MFFLFQPALILLIAEARIAFPYQWKDESAKAFANSKQVDKINFNNVSKLAREDIA